MCREIEVKLTRKQYQWLKGNIKQSKTEEDQCVHFGADERTIIIKHIFNEDKRVPDCWRYSVGKNQEEKFDKSKKPKSDFKSKYDDREIKDISENENILLLLESPHKNEYSYLSDKDRFKMIPVRPAQGITGIKINSFLDSIIKGCGLDKNVAYNVIISNPVQFQTSLYCLHGFPNCSGSSVRSGIRNAVWNALMILEKDNFVKRLEEYSPVAVINSCTKILRKDLQELLNSFYNDGDEYKIDSPRLFCTNHHPSRWGKDTTVNEIDPFLESNSI